MKWIASSNRITTIRHHRHRTHHYAALPSVERRTEHFFRCGRRGQNWRKPARTGRPALTFLSSHDARLRFEGSFGRPIVLSYNSARQPTDGPEMIRAIFVTMAKDGCRRSPQPRDQSEAVSGTSKVSPARCQIGSSQSGSPSESAEYVDIDPSELATARPISRRPQ